MYIARKLLTDADIVESGTIVEKFDTISPIFPAQSWLLNSNAKFFMKVTDASGGSPTLVITIRGLLEFGTPQQTNFDLGSFASVSTSGQYVKEITNCPRHIEIGFIVGGTTPVFEISMWVNR